MQDFGALIVPFVMLVSGWLCTRRPTSVVRFMTSWVEQSNPTGKLNKSQELAKHVREHPDSWAQQYPLVYQQIQISGFVAYLIFVVGLFIILVSWVTG